jgi:hypothetical protein
MTTEDRLDQLLDDALAMGRIPDDATPEERAEIEAMLPVAGALHRSARDVNVEAEASLPVARARFQRHIAAAAAPATPATPARTGGAGARSGLFGAIFGSVGALRYSATAAAIGMVVLAAILVARPFSGVETVSALGVDDYVQVQGVVSETSDDFVTVESSEFGSLRIDLSDQTSIVGNDGADRSALRPGESVLISGVVREAHKRDIRIAANSLALAGQAPADRPVVTALKELRKSNEALEGTLTVLAISGDGANARILLDTGRGHQFVVNVDRESVASFVAGSSGIGSRVRVYRDEALPAGVFRFEALGQGASSSGGAQSTPGSTIGMGGHAPAHGLVNLGGTVISRDLATLTVRTDRGDVPVLVRKETRIVLGQSGLTFRDILAGESVIGYPVVVRGSLPDGGGTVTADLILVGAPHTHH